MVLHHNTNDTSISKSGHLDLAIPPSKIAGLSSGDFVGMVADDPGQPIKLKVFNSRLINDVKKLESEEDRYQPIPVKFHFPGKSRLEV